MNIIPFLNLVWLKPSRFGFDYINDTVFDWSASLYNIYTLQNETINLLKG